MHINILLSIALARRAIQPPHDKTNKMTSAPSEDSVRPVWSVFAVRMQKAWVLSYPLSVQRRLWPDWADAQADLSLRWAHIPFCWFCHEAAQCIIQNFIFSRCCIQLHRYSWGDLPVPWQCQSRRESWGYTSGWCICAVPAGSFLQYSTGKIFSCQVWSLKNKHIMEKNIIDIFPTHVENVL